MEVSQKLKKSCKSTKVAEFLQQEYILPELGIYNGKVVHFCPTKKSQGAINVSDHNQLPKQFACSQKKLTEVKQKMYAANRNANKKFNHRKAVIAQQKACVKSQQWVINMHESKLKGVNHQVDQLRAKAEPSQSPCIVLEKSSRNYYSAQ